MEPTHAPADEAGAPLAPEPEPEPASDVEATGEAAPRRDWAWVLVVIGVALLLATCVGLALIAAGRAPVGAPG